MTSKPRHTIKLDHDLEQVLLPFFYFDIFSHPLTLDEVYAFGQHTELSKDRMKSLIQMLVDRQFLHHIKDYYLLHDQPDWVSLRETNNQRAQQFLPKAHMMSRLMSKFPFVRAVFISGSLSKNVMPEGGDIDYFIVTQPGRLWIARTLLVLFKKLFLFNSHKYFCVNYFVDQNHLEIEEKNRFTATEIITLLPTYGQQYYQQFFAGNTWAKKYYPCFPERAVTEIPVHQSGWVQQTGEFFFKGKTGDWVDRFFMKKTLNYWHRKFENFDKDKFAIALKSRPYVSKHHPLDFQTRVLAEYQNRMDLFAEKHQVQFHTKFP